MSRKKRREGKKEKEEEEEKKNRMAIAKVFAFHANAKNDNYTTGNL